MADRFVSGGTMIPPGEDPPRGTDAAAANTARPFLAAGKDTSIEWAAVQKELEEARRTKAVAVRGEERSLYDVLQANKAAKQAAFEEQTKIRNQFRPLDDDEIEFLDEVKAAKRMEEERVRRETEEGLRAFREQQRRTSGGGAVGADVGAEGDEDAVAGAGAGGGEMQSAGTGEWGAGRKRKRGRERERIGLVKRKVEGEIEEARNKGSKERMDIQEADGATTTKEGKDIRTTKDAQDTRQSEGVKEIKQTRISEETNEAKMAKDTTGSRESQEPKEEDRNISSSGEKVPIAEEKNGAQNGQAVIATDKSRETQKEDAVPAGQKATGSGEGGRMGSKQKSLLVSYGSDDSDDE
ncbi:hypothetical protein E4U57_004971 [Claviceps arundinis]|uniref:FAM192A/Fyv6 N-terminal domain-containing protein n=1 Tax=Claviceps arundinis TaxID=1623583 RepID=A0ABQ7P424_9HYPO|nr:hypothetical protein E4U57_004971 [Claviceps arundinis]